MARAGAEGRAVLLAGGQGAQQAVGGGVADDDGGAGLGAVPGQPQRLLLVGQGVQVGPGLAVGQQVDGVQSRALVVERLAEPGAVRQERPGSGQQVQVALGAGGEDEVVPGGAGFPPGHRAGPGAVQRGQRVDVEAGAGDQGEADPDAVVAVEDRQHVQQPVERHRRTDRDQHAPLPARHRPPPGDGGAGGAPGGVVRVGEAGCGMVPIVSRRPRVRPADRRSVRMGPTPYPRLRVWG